MRVVRARARRASRRAAAPARGRECRSPASICRCRETPVTTVSRPSGNSTSMFFRLCSRAPRTISLLAVGLAALARARRSRRAPERYCPVSEPALRAMSRRRARGDQFAAEPSGAGAEVDHVVGALDGLLVVLHHQHRVAQVAQLRQRVEQAAVVARVQADGGLVQHVEHAAQLASRSAWPAGCAALRRRRASPPSGPGSGSPAPPPSGTPGACGSRRPRARRSASRAR